MRKTIHIKIVFFLFPLYCFSQNEQTIDSLKSLLEKATHDTIKSKLYYNLAWNYQQINPDKCLSYATQAMALADETGDSAVKAWTYKAMGWAYLYKNDFQNSIPLFEKSLSLSSYVKDKRFRGYCFESLSNAYEKQGKYAKATEVQIKWLKISEKEKDTANICSSFTGIGKLYFYQYRYEIACDYFTRALTLSEKTGDTSMVNNSLGNIALMYSSMGKNKEALETYNKLSKIYLKSSNKTDLASNYLNMGVCYLNMKGCLNAKSNYEKALFIYEELKDGDNITVCCMNLSEVCGMLGDFENAVIFGKRAVALAIQKHNKEYLKDAYMYLSSVYEKQKKYKEAYENHQLYSQLKDTLLNEESSKQITEMQTKYDTEKKEQQITLLNKDKELQDAQLNRQKIIIWSVAGGLLVVLVLSIFIFRERRKSEKLLLNILPVETAKELKRNGKATAKHYESVTVMFTDFKGFTTIAEKLSAEKLVSELDFLFKKFDEIISKYK